MLARENRTNSFTKNAGDVMSELLLAIQRVRGSEPNCDKDGAVDCEDSTSKPVYLKPTRAASIKDVSKNGIKTFAVTGREVPLNAIAAREILRQKLAGPSDSFCNISVLDENLFNSDSKANSSAASLVPGQSSPTVHEIPPPPSTPPPLSAPSIPQAPPSPPIPQISPPSIPQPPPPPDFNSLPKWKKTAPISKNSVASQKPQHVPSWTPNRPSRFVPNDINANVFAELTALLQKRFRKSDVEEHEGESESLKKENISDVPRSSKILSEKSTDHSLRNKDVNIVIVEKGSTEKSRQGLNGDSAPSVNTTNVPPVTPKQGHLHAGKISGLEKKLLNGEYVSMSTAAEEGVLNRTVKVSQLIQTYQTSEDHATKYAPLSLNKSSTPSDLNSSGKQVDIHPVQNYGVCLSEVKLPETSSAEELKNGAIGNTSCAMEDKDATAPSPEDLSVKSSVEENSVQGEELVLKVGQNMSNKMESPVGEETFQNDRSSDEESVKAVVVHGSLDSSPTTIQRRGKPRSTMTETAIASIILDKAIESDIDSDVFFEKSSVDRTLAVSDSEINRYKEEIFGIKSLRAGSSKKSQEKEMKEIKEVLSSSSAPTSVRCQKITVRPTVIETDLKLQKDFSHVVSADFGVKSGNVVPFRDNIDSKEQTINGSVKTNYSENDSVKSESVSDVSGTNVSDISVANVLPVLDVKPEADGSAQMPDHKSDGLDSNVPTTNSENSGTLNNKDSQSAKILLPVVGSSEKKSHSRFSSMSSDTSSLESVHNSSEELVVVADVHVSSDDDKVLEALALEDSAWLGEHEPKPDNDQNSDFSPDKIEECEMSSRVDFHSHKRTFSFENPKLKSEYEAENDYHSSTAVSENAEHVNISKPHKELLQKESISTENSEDSTSTHNTSVSHDQSNIAMVNNKHAFMAARVDRESPSSSLGDYDFPDPPLQDRSGRNALINEGVMPVHQSSPCPSEHSNSNLIDEPHSVSKQVQPESVAGMYFSEEELDNTASSESDRDATGTIPESKKNNNNRSSVKVAAVKNSPSDSLTDSEVQKITQKCLINGTAPVQQFALSRHCIHSDESSITRENVEGYFQPLSSGESFTSSSQSEQEVGSVVLDQELKRPDNVSNISDKHQNLVKSEELRDQQGTTLVNAHVLNSQPTTVISQDLSGNDNSVINFDASRTQGYSFFADVMTDEPSEMTMNSLKSRSQHLLSRTFQNTSKDNSVTVLNNGSPPQALHVVKNNQVVRYVPVQYIPMNQLQYEGNQLRHHNKGYHSVSQHPPGHRRVFKFDSLARDYHLAQRSRSSRSPNRAKPTTIFYDFNQSLNHPRRLADPHRRTNHLKYNKNTQYSSQRSGHGAVTVMHIAPENRDNGSDSVAGFVRQTRPVIAGYGPDHIDSSHNTQACLPLSPVDVFSNQRTLQQENAHGELPRRKPSFTVMTSSNSSFTDSSGQEKIYIDLRKSKSKRSSSKSGDRHLKNQINTDSTQSEADQNTAVSKLVPDNPETSHNPLPLVHLVSISKSPQDAESIKRIVTQSSQDRSQKHGMSVQIFVNSETKVTIDTEGDRNTGSPFIIDVDEGRMPTASGDGLYRGEEDRPATFYVDARGLRGELGVQVEGPNSIAKCNIEPERDGLYAVTYVPVEVGKYKAFVKWNGKEIPGSPFHPKVVDPRKVKVVGGWQSYMDQNNRVQLLVDEEKRIPFDVSEAGPGVLTAEVRGPGGKIPCYIEETGHHKRAVCFTPREEGDHQIHAYWSDHTLVNAPFHGYAMGRRRSPDPSKVVLSGRGLKEAVVHREAEFQIDGSEAGPGRPEVQLIGVKRNIPVRVSSLGNGRYRCTYMAETAGAYLLHINWNDRQLRGSPFKVNVIHAHYPQKVVVTGEGLKGGVMGRDINVIIDTSKAGPGELTAHCMGPHLVAYCELEDMRDGTYKLNIRPQEPGRHILQIKYGGDHVLGSPYVLRVGAQPDASKVRVSGPGVEHGVLANFQSRFIVETRGAGAGQLTVRIRGPKGAFQVEMLRESQKERTIMCRFDPSETGLYQIFVKWSGVDVPGSPFNVYIVDTETELRHVMQGQIPPQYHSSTLNRSIYNSEYSTWREDDYRM